LSVIGIINTVGEVLIGWIGDQQWTNLNALYAICMLACGISTALVPFLTIYRSLAIVAGIFGFAISANYSLTSPMLVSMVSIDEFSSAYGLLLLIQGVSNLAGPPFAGYLYDISHIWYYTFGLGGTFIAISGVMLVVLPSTNWIKHILVKINSRRSR
jgi:MFS family permease